MFDNIDNIINKNDIDYNFNIIRDLLFIINNYTNHSNKSIMNRSIFLHKNIICKYLDFFFNYNNDNNNLENINIYNINSELNDAITVNHDIDNEILKGKNNDLINNNKNCKMNSIDSSNNKLLSLNNNSPFLKDIFNNPNYFNKKTEGQIYPDNFFNVIYLKGGINHKTELLRKKICLQLYNILKLVLPSYQEEIFKKNFIGIFGKRCRSLV